MTRMCLVMGFLGMGSDPMRSDAMGCRWWSRSWMMSPSGNAHLKFLTWKINIFTASHGVSVCLFSFRSTSTPFSYVSPPEFFLYLPDTFLACNLHSLPVKFSFHFVTFWPHLCRCWLYGLCRKRCRIVTITINQVDRRCVGNYSENTCAHTQSSWKINWNFSKVQGGS